MEQHDVQVSFSSCYLVLTYSKQKAPELRHAQKILADEVTELVHTGKPCGCCHVCRGLTSNLYAAAEGVSHAQAATKIVFNTDLTDVNSQDVVSALHNDPRLRLVQASDIFDIPLNKVAATFGLATSNGESVCIFISKT